MSELRRRFDLQDADRGFLETRGLPWEAVIEGQTLWLVIHDHPIPPGYGVSRASLALQIPKSYPATQLDMVYVFPCLVRNDGLGVPNLSSHSFDGREWQQWSRHRTGANPWRPEEDSVETHLLLVLEWFEREFRRNVV